MRTTILLALLVTVAAPAAGELVFADGFETGDDRYWSGPLDTCTVDGGDPAPACPDSMDLMPWLAACEAGEPCYHLCPIDPVTADHCLLLGVEPVD